MSEEIYRCPKCRQSESYLYNSFDECVSYVHCSCKKKAKFSPEYTGTKKPLDLAFDVLKQFLKEEKVK